jgi:putative chitinase
MRRTGLPIHASAEDACVITLEDLRAICKHAKQERLALFVEPLNATMDEFEISANPARETHFLAQICHESGCFRYVEEIASGEAYEGRADLGNTEPGDGVRFKGRGLIQITGRANYKACGEALGHDFIADPTALEQPVYAARSAAWFWDSRNLNELADRGDSRAITKRINGGLNGYQDRLSYLALAQERLA